MPKGDEKHMEKSKKGFDFGIDETGDDVYEGVLDYLRKVKEKVKLHTFVVFGSRARGDYKPGSDVDIVIIADDLPKGWERVMLFYGIDKIVPIEPRAYTSEEFLKGIERIDVTTWDSLHEGIILYDDGFWEKAKKKFDEVKKEYGLVKTKTGWKALNPF
jgi:hypothetical protein